MQYVMGEYWLPPELLAQVISYLIAPADFSLAQYATVSRNWQTIIEKRTFSSLLLNTPQLLEEFEQIVARDKRRRSYLRNINLVVQLEPCVIGACTQFETAEERGRNNKIFEETILSLFRILEPWPEDPVGIKLSIEALSPCNAFGEEVRELNMRHKEKYLQFAEESLDVLPTVRVITTLSVAGSSRLPYWLIQPASCAIIASRLPWLHTIVLDVTDHEKRDKALRKRNRDDFARCFNLCPSSVKKFSLNCYDHLPEAHYDSPPNLVGMNIEDPLCAGLRQFSQQLTTISLDHVTVGRELFWPVNTKDEPPFWPNLTTFFLKYTMATPSGKWLFEHTPEEDEDQWRISHSEHECRDIHIPDHLFLFIEHLFSEPFWAKVSPELMNEFYMSAGRAAQRMPCLKYMRLGHRLPALHEFNYKVNGGRATATWTDMTSYQPEEGVLQTWRDVACQHTGSHSNLEVEIRHLRIPGTRNRS